jgi:hypothetical protein
MWKYPSSQRIGFCSQVLPVKDFPLSGSASAQLSIIRLASNSNSRWTRYRSPLITYLLADIGCSAVEWLAWLAYGPGIAYGRIWGLANAITFLAVCWLVYDALSTRLYRARSVVLAGMVSFLFAGWTWGWLRSPTFFDWINLADGTSMAFGGVVLAYTAPYHKPSTVHLVLGWYFLLVALYDFLFVAGWTSANLYIPQVLQLIAFGTIFRLLRRQPHLPRYSA